MMGRIALSITSIAILLVAFGSRISKHPTQTHPINPASTSFEALPDTSTAIATDLSDYIWPTEAERNISSVFAEYRSTHFHGGIDVSTGRKQGFKVFAARNGYVARIIVSPTGYGKMLWLRHADGYYSTYAHLQKFNSELDAFVEQEQLRLQRYPLYVECSPRDFPVRKGELIAYTGDTGTGSEHLHFEIRDPKKDFINPLLCKQLSFTDNFPPRIRAIGVTPVGPNSYVDGSPSARVIDFSPPREGTVTLAEPLYASGVFGFIMDTRDRIDGSRFNSGIYTNTLYLDDSLIYSVQFDRAPSADGHQVGLYYDFGLMSDEGGRLARLFVDTPNKLPFYEPRTDNAGLIDTRKFSPGAHSFKIVSRDFWNNSTQISGTIIFSKPFTVKILSADNALEVTPVGQNTIATIELFGKTFTRKKKSRDDWTKLKLPASGIKVDLKNISSRYGVLKIVARDAYGMPSTPEFYYPKKPTAHETRFELAHETETDFVRVTVKTNGAITARPSASVLEGTNTQKLTFDAIDYNHYEARFVPNKLYRGKRSVVAECEVNGRLSTLQDEFTILPISPHESSPIAFDGGALQLEIDSRSFFRPFFLEIQRHNGTTPGYSLLPRHVVLNEGIGVKIRVPDRTKQDALYFRSRRSQWRMLGTERQGEFLVGRLESTLGEVTSLNDATQPSITRLALPTRATRLPHTVSFRVTDNLSGVEYKGLKLYIDEKFVIPEIDGEHRRVTGRLVEPLRRGSHTIRILLQDRVGNTTELNRQFTVR